MQPPPSSNTEQVHPLQELPGALSLLSNAAETFFKKQQPLDKSGLG